MRRPLVAFGLVVAGACSLPSADEFAHPRADSTADGGAPKLEAGTLEAGTPNDASTDASLDASVDATVDAGPPITNLLGGNTSDFELGDCSGSGGYHSTRTGDPTPHTGNFSCRICRDGSGTAFTIDTTFLQNPTVGVTFHAFAWVRTAPGASTPGPVRIILRTTTQNGTVTVQQSNSENVTLTDTYQQIEVELQVTSTTMGTSADAYVTSDANDAACFLVDDFTVWQTGP